MIGVEEQLLAEAIRDTLRSATRAETHLACVEESNTLHNVEEGRHAEQLAEASETLRWHVLAAYRHIAVLAERLALPDYAAEVTRARSGHKDLAQTEHTPWDVQPVSPALAEARQLFQPLEAMLLGGTGTALGILERILRNTPTIVARFGTTPTREHDVATPVVETLRTCFPDVASEGEILQAGRKLRCDAAIASLRAAVEFKFIDRRAKARPVLDGIVADVSNYGDDPRWRSFFAVVYQTRRFIDEAELREKVRGSGGRSAWTVIVVEPQPASGAPVP